MTRPLKENLSTSSISPFLENSLWRKTTSRDSISIIVSFGCSPSITYPLDSSEYLMNIHLFTLGPSSHIYGVAVNTAGCPPWANVA